MPTQAKVSEVNLAPNRLYAVLTGDVIGSSSLNDAARRNLPMALKEASTAARAVFKKAIPLNADIFRGDSWQLVVTEAHLSLRVALFFRAYLHGQLPEGRGFDTRIAVGIGAITFLPKQRLSQGDGLAFRKSGATLEDLPKTRHLALAVEDREMPPGVGVVVTLIDALMTRWTRKQALAVVGALQGKNQGKIGRSWRPPVKQQVIARHLRQACWEVIEKEGLVYVENTLQRLY